MNRKLKKIPSAVKFILGTFVLAALSPLISAAFQGIVGDFSVAVFHSIMDAIVNFKNIAIVLWIAVCVQVISIILGIAYYQYKIKVLESKQQSLIALFTLKEGFIRMASGLLRTNEAGREEAMQRLIKKLLVDAILVLPHVYGASLYLPDINREVLKIWESNGVPSNYLAHAECYIGPARPDRKTGVAGEAFTKQEIIVARMTGEKTQDNSWKFDRDSYIDFATTGTPPPYSALACVPLLDKKGTSASLGVVCFDSREKDAYESQEVQESLVLIGRCFTSALLIYQDINSNQ